jgi:hypothetical protein
MIHQMVKIQRAQPATVPQFVDPRPSYLVLPLVEIGPRTTPIRPTRAFNWLTGLVACTYQHRQAGNPAMRWEAANDN